MSLTKNIGENIGKNISKTLSGKYSQYSYISPDKKQKYIGDLRLIHVIVK